MSDFAIDYNRGMTIRMHSEGFDVSMYKDDPGVFFSNNGKRLSSVIAREAGFDVKALDKLKEKRDRIQAARDAIEREYGVPVNEVIAQAAGYSVVSLGNDLYSLTDEDGAVMTHEPMGRQEALILLGKLGADEEPETPTLNTFDVDATDVHLEPEVLSHTELRPADFVAADISPKSEPTTGFDVTQHEYSLPTEAPLKKRGRPVGSKNRT